MNRYADMTIWALREEMKTLQAELATRDVTPRPAQPVEATPTPTLVERLRELASCRWEYGHERILEEAATALSLAQTENAGHIRIEDELKAELREAQAGNRIWRDRRDAALALVEKAESDLAKAQARCAELEKAFERVERELAYLLRT